MVLAYSSCSVEKNFIWPRKSWWVGNLLLLCWILIYLFLKILKSQSLGTCDLAEFSQRNGDEDLWDAGRYFWSCVATADHSSFFYFPILIFAPLMLRTTIPFRNFIFFSVQICITIVPTLRLLNLLHSLFHFKRNKILHSNDIPYKDGSDILTHNPLE